MKNKSLVFLESWGHAWTEDLKEPRYKSNSLFNGEKSRQDICLVCKDHDLGRYWVSEYDGRIRK